MLREDRSWADPWAGGEGFPEAGAQAWNVASPGGASDRRPGQARETGGQARDGPSSQRARVQLRVLWGMYAPGKGVSA